LKKGDIVKVWEYAKQIINDTEWVKKDLDDFRSLWMELAACGYGREALKIVEDSSSAALLEPLVVGLKIHLGEEVKVATEIEEVGKDVAKRIEARRKEVEENTGLDYPSAESTHSCR
jgi:hypothetical protein